MLSFLIWFPILTALFLFLVPIRESRPARWIALLPILAALAGALCLLRQAPPMGGDRVFVENVAWAPQLGITYHLGVDRLGAALILLTALVSVAAVATAKVERQPRFFFGLGLLMAGGLIGAFASLDLFFLYIFHEFALIPTFILIGLWGAERRRYAAMKITLYLGFGSLVLLIGILALYLFAGANTFNLPALQQHLAAHPLDARTQAILFGILFFGFGILISLFPFHTWAPIGYSEAPPLAAMLHAGVIKKFGFFGLLLVAPLLPEGFAWWRNIIVTLAVCNLVYCGYVALQQKDLRMMLAYASVSHMGYAFLAFAAQTPLAMQGLLLFLFAHGLGAAAGFGLAGACRDRVGTSLLSETGGLARRLPFLATAFTMTALAGCGLPGFASFPAELMIFLGSFRAYPWATVAALWTAVISAVYFLRAVRNVFLGPLPDKWAGVQEMDMGRRVGFALLLGALLLTGFRPALILGKTTAADPADDVARTAQTNSEEKH